MLCILTVQCHAELILMHCYDLPIVIVDFHFFCANNQEFEIVLTLKICGFCLNGKILEAMRLVKA